VIHSRACWFDEYRTAGRPPSGVAVAPLVTLSAMIGWPLTVWPIVSSLVMPGFCFAVAVNSSFSPPGSL
jgi:hypothetical protein